MINRFLDWLYSHPRFVYWRAIAVVYGLFWLAVILLINHLFF